MPYTSPATVVTATTITTAWGNSVKAATDYLANPPICVVSNSANISVATATVVPVTFNTEQTDTDTMHSTVSNTSRVTFNTAGVYVLTGNLSYASNATGFRGAFIYRNGGSYLLVNRIASEWRQANNGDVTEMTVTRTFKFAAAEFVELVAFQTSGGALNTLTSGGFAPTFSAVWVGNG